MNMEKGKRNGEIEKNTRGGGHKVISVEVGKAPGLLILKCKSKICERPAGVRDTGER